MEKYLSEFGFWGAWVVVDVASIAFKAAVYDYEVAVRNAALKAGTLDDAPAA